MSIEYIPLQVLVNVIVESLYYQYFFCSKSIVIKIFINHKCQNLQGCHESPDKTNQCLAWILQNRMRRQQQQHAGDAGDGLACQKSIMAALKSESIYVLFFKVLDL